MDRALHYSKHWRHLVFCRDNLDTYAYFTKPWWYFLNIPCKLNVDMECSIVKQNTCLTKQSVSIVTSDDGKHLPDKGPSPYREMDTKYFAKRGIDTSKETVRKIAGVLAVIF